LTEQNWPSQTFDLVARSRNLPVLRQHGSENTRHATKPIHTVRLEGAHPAPRRKSLNLGGNLAAVFLQDEYAATSWLRLNGGVRFTHFAASTSEDVASPRAGAAIRIPKLNWTLRGFYGRFYQAPPLSTVSGPLLRFVLDQGFGIIPLYGERDEERQFGVLIPVHGWTLDIDNFRTHARRLRMRPAFRERSRSPYQELFLALTHAWKI